ncbi:SAM-dependent methyltransferase [Methanosarcina sp. KYL-1]|uniref:acetylserotonin O-methyltransferase n=1 Tax=Methanosarcina sp. KYL-1 TaxID=2602068 RepID=UPI002100EE67|nr:acetylserotonin O-methyltransferase [Methanosarcina sp. KYL-1]MCQ1535312.1 SAM-dependent methyltransferase [Methanosarcina sp. KYL-1]
MKVKNELMETPSVGADRFFKIMDDSIRGLKEYRLIVTALELEVFEALKTPLQAGELAEKLGCDPVLVPHFCEALVSLGLLDRFEEIAEVEKESREYEGEDRAEKNTVSPWYVNSELSTTYLLKETPFSQQQYLSEMSRNVARWARLPELMRKGPEVVDKGPFFWGIISCMAENARCGLLQETVRTVMENVDLGKVRKLLDMGGGHGLYAIAFAKMNEQLEAFVFDLPPVTVKTKQYIEKYGASNVDVVPGDFFKDELGTEYDLIFSSSNPGGKVPKLIPKIASALNEGGVFVTRQFSEENTESNPLLNLDWNLWTFEDTKKGGSGYSFENSVPFNEYIEMLGDYGLEVFRTLDMKCGSRMVFAKKQV